MKLKIKSLNIKRKENYFFLAYGIYLLALYFPKTSFYIDGNIADKILVCMRYFSYSILSIGLLIEKADVKKMTLFGILLLIYTYALWNSDKTIVFGLIFAYAARKIEMNKILRFTYRYCVIQYVIVLVSALIGIINNKVIIMDDRRLRYALGFGHPNNTSMYFFIILLLYFIIQKGYIKGRKILLWMILSTIIYGLTQSRTGFIMDVLLILIAAVYKPLYRLIEKSKIIKIIIAEGVPLFAVLNYIIAFQYERNNYIREISSLLTGRFNLASKALQTWGVSIWGRPIKWTYTLGQQYLVVDSSYMRNLIEFGLVGFGLLLFCYFIFCWNCMNHNNIVYAVAVLLIAVYSNMEIILASFGINPLFVLFGPGLFNAAYSNRNKQKRKVVYSL